MPPSANYESIPRTFPLVAMAKRDACESQGPSPAPARLQRTQTKLQPAPTHRSGSTLNSGAGRQLQRPPTRVRANSRSTWSCPRTGGASGLQARAHSLFTWSTKPWQSVQSVRRCDVFLGRHSSCRSSSATLLAQMCRLLFWSHTKTQQASKFNGFGPPLDLTACRLPCYTLTRLHLLNHRTHARYVWRATLAGGGALDNLRPSGVVDVVVQLGSWATPLAGYVVEAVLTRGSWGTLFMRSTPQRFDIVS